MAGTNWCKRVVLGTVAGALAIGPLAVAAGAQDDGEDVPAATSEAVFEALQFYADEIFGQDLDGDGSPDVVDTDGDGIPDMASVDEGDPGERDIQPGNPLFLAEITEDLQAVGVDTIVENTEGSELRGDCGGLAMSFDGDGQMIDMAVGIPSREGGGPDGQLIDAFGDNFGDRAFTTDNPFIVDDTVVYIGTLPRNGDGALEHNWTIKTAGISIDKGGDPNENGKNRNAGEVDVGSVPDLLRPAGIFPVKGELTSQNGLFCIADGWIKFEGGNPLLSAPSAVAAVFGGAGIVGLLFNSRPAITCKA